MTDTATASSAPQASAATAGSYPWWAVLVQGIAAVIIGVMLLTTPISTTVALIYFIGWYWIISGIFELGSLFWNREMWGWKLFSGILGVVAGGYIVAAPFIGAIIVVGTITLLLGINGMVIGVIDIVKAFQGAGWGKGILGAFSLIIGAVIAFNVTTFAVAMPWIWGVLGIGFGIAAIVMSFRLRKATA
jgi:uncharacterized membrane protein HdeD (DUF308 family)